MSTQQESHDIEVAGSPTAITRRTAEIATALVIAAFAMLAIVSTYQIGAGWSDDGPQAGYFPMRMGIAIFVASIAVLIQAIRKNDQSAFVEREQLKLVATVLLPLTVYIATIQYIGIYVASALFIGIFMALVGKFSWLKSVITGVGINLAIFWIFEIFFKVPLPKGPLEQMFGY
jgi:putative tricarboxylic transport membrane protein